MIASLPMYLRDENRAAYDRFWQGIATRLGSGLAAPTLLQHDEDVWHQWMSPDLLLSQTCGLPFRSALHDKVSLIGTPDYRLPGCPPGYYNSVLVMHRKSASSDPLSWARRTFAANDKLSESGWAAPQRHMSAFDMSFETVWISGSHRASAKAVAVEMAGIAAIDAQTWRMIQRWDDWSKNLIEVVRTTPTPGLPLISAYPEHKDVLFHAVRTQIEALDRKDRAVLDLHDLVAIPKDAYLALN